MNKETAGMAVEHSFCNVCFPERQNEPFGDIRTSVGGSLLRGIASAASELVSNELDGRCVFARYTHRDVNLYRDAALRSFESDHLIVSYVSFFRHRVAVSRSRGPPMSVSPLKPIQDSRGSAGESRI